MKSIKETKHSTDGLAYWLTGQKHYPLCKLLHGSNFIFKKNLIKNSLVAEVQRC